MKRIMLLVTLALVMAAMIVAMTMPAFADEGGVPNEKACHGQVVKTENQLGNTPHEGAEQVGVDNAGELNKGVKSGEFGSDTGLSCPPQ